MALEIENIVQQKIAMYNEQVHLLNYKCAVNNEMHPL